MLTVVNFAGQRYLDAARRVLEAVGWRGITMRAVADEAGTSATAIYRHFADKEALLETLQKSVFAAFRARIVEAVEKPAGSARARLIRALEAYRDFGLDDPAGFEFLFTEPHGVGTSRYPEDFRRGGSSTFRMLAEAVRDCMDEGVLRPGDPVDVALALDAQVLGLMTLYRSGRFGDDAERFREFFRFAVERQLGGEETR